MSNLDQFFLKTEPEQTSSIPTNPMQPANDLSQFFTTTPTKTIAPRTTTTQAPKENNALQRFAQNTIARPAIRAGQAVGGLISQGIIKSMPDSNPNKIAYQQNLDKALKEDVKTPFLGTTPAVKPMGEGFGKQLLTETGKTALDVGTIGYGNVLNGLTRALFKKGITTAVPQIAKSKTASTLANYATKATGNIVEFGAYNTGYNALNGKPLKENLGTSSIIGAGIPIVGGMFTKGAPTIYKLLAKTFSQTPEKAIDLFVANPTLGKKALNNAINDVDGSIVFKIADTAQTAVDDIQRLKTAQFTEGLSKGKLGSVILNKDKIFNKFQSVLESHGLIQNGMSQIDQVLPVETEIKTMQNIINRVNNQKSFDIQSLLTLKQFLDGQYGNNSPKFNSIIQDLKRTLVKEMPKKVKSLLKESSNFENLLATMKKEFGISRGAGGGVDLGEEGGQLIIRENTQKVINALRKAFSEKSEVGPILLQQMEKLAGKEIMYDIAAQFFKSKLPPGGLQSVIGLSAGSVPAVGAAILNPATLFGSIPMAVATGSPRVVGRMSIGAGKIKNALDNIPLPVGTGKRELPQIKSLKDKGEILKTTIKETPNKQGGFIAFYGTTPKNTELIQKGGFKVFPTKFGDGVYLAKKSKDAYSFKGSLIKADVPENLLKIKSPDKEEALDELVNYAVKELKKQGKSKKFIDTFLENAEDYQLGNKAKSILEKKYSGIIQNGSDIIIWHPEKIKVMQNKSNIIPKPKAVEKKANEFLADWTNTDSQKDGLSVFKKHPLSLKEIDDLADYFKKISIPESNPPKTITLYRGIEKGQKEGLLDRPTAWTRLKEVAKDHTYGNGKVIKIKATPDQILVEMNALPNKMLRKYAVLADEEEVILKPLKKTGVLDKLKKIPNKQGGMISTLPAYKGEKDLTTKILKDLEGKTTVSKQYILDATNRGELKQVERELVRDMLKGEGDTVNVSNFAKKVKAELLPLKMSEPFYQGSSRWEYVSLNKDLRGNVKNYKEHIYESPIKTSAGGTHFNKVDAPNYFGHTRIEDMADNKTRRVIEVQSDLYQKGRLETSINESQNLKDVTKDKSVEAYKKLSQYNDPTAHFRMVREEIKKASQDGKTKLQFPTGETAMKIEGLGSQSDWVAVDFSQYNTPQRIVNRTILTPDTLKAGMDIQQGGVTGGGQRWIITDVLGDGKFKAVPKKEVGKIGSWEQIKKMFKDDPALEGMQETFDISGKIDINNPIYRFYEKDLGRYLQNKFGAKTIVDDKGVSWMEVPIKKNMKGAVEAFGKIATSPLFIGAGIGGAAVGGKAIYDKEKRKILPKEKSIFIK